MILSKDTLSISNDAVIVNYDTLSFFLFLMEEDSNIKLCVVVV